MSVSAPSYNTVSVRDLLVFYYKFRKRLIASFLVPFLLIVGLSFVPSPRYPITSVLTVRLGSEYVYQPEIGTSETSSQAPIPFNPAQIFKAEVAILNSTDLHEEVLKVVGVYNVYPELYERSLLAPLLDPIKSYVNSLMEIPPLTEAEIEQRRLETAVALFEKKFDLNLEKESSVIEISYSHKSSVVGIHVLNELLRLYLDKRQMLYLDPRAKLAREHAEEAHQGALRAEKAVEDYRRQHNIHALNEEKLSLIAERSETEKQRATINSPVLDQKLAFFNAQLDKLSAVQTKEEELEQDAKVAEDEYALFAHRLGEAIASDDLEHERAASVRIIQPPSAPIEPKSIQLLLIAAGVVLSLICLLVTAMLTEISQAGFLTPEQLERAIGLPVLAAVRKLKRRQERP